MFTCRQIFMAKHMHNFTTANVNYMFTVVKGYHIHTYITSLKTHLDWSRCGLLCGTWDDVLDFDIVGWERSFLLTEKRNWKAGMVKIVSFDRLVCTWYVTSYCYCVLSHIYLTKEKLSSLLKLQKKVKKFHIWIRISTHRIRILKESDQKSHKNIKRIWSEIYVINRKVLRNDRI